MNKCMCKVTVSKAVAIILKFGLDTFACPRIQDTSDEDTFTYHTVFPGQVVTIEAP